MKLRILSPKELASPEYIDFTEIEIVDNRGDSFRLSEVLSGRVKIELAYSSDDLTVVLEDDNAFILRTV